MKYLRDEEGIAVYEGYTCEYCGIIFLEPFSRCPQCRMHTNSLPIEVDHNLEPIEDVLMD